MKIGTMVYFDKTDGLEKRFEDLVRFGFDNCQLCSWTPDLWTEQNAQLISELLGKYNITVSAFWCGWAGPQVWDFYEGPRTLGLLPREYREERVKNLCDGADFARLLGVTDVATHIGFIPENPNDPDFAPLCDAIRTVAEHLKKNGQHLLFETGQETPVSMLRCFENVGADNLAVNLDTANLILYGKANPVDALEVLGKFVRNIHAKDGTYPTNGHDLGQETRLGDGMVDFAKLFSRLKDLGYDGYVTIEREIDGERQTEDILYAKKYLEKMIG